MATSLGKIVVQFVGDTKGLDKATKRVKTSVDKVDKSQKKAKTSAKGLGTSFIALKSSAMLYVGGALAIVAVIAKSIKAFDTQQQAVIALNTALANQGKFSVAASLDLQRYASSLQAVTTFGDEAILKGMALATTFGLNGEKLKETTRLALDFATATGRDMTMAMNLLGKAAVGETAELKRYGIIIDASLPKNEKFAAVLQQLEQRFGGAAQAATKTFGGALKQAGNLLGDMMEGIGKTLSVLLGFGGEGSNALSPVLWALTNLSEFFNTILPTAVSLGKLAFKNWVATMLQGFALVLDAVGYLPDWMGGGAATNAAAKLMVWANGMKTGAQAVYEAEKSFISLNQASAQTAGQLEQSANAAEALATGINTSMLGSLLNFVDGLKTTDEALMFTQSTFQMTDAEMKTLAGSMDMKTIAIAESFKRMGITTSAEQAKLVAQMQADFEMIKNSGVASAAELMVAEQKLAAEKMKLHGLTAAFTMDQNLQVVAGALSGFAQLGDKFKVFAIAQAIISTYLAIAKAMSSLPWPMNLVSAAGAAAAGFANVAKIKSSKSHRTGTGNLDFADFGTETPAMLHGKEAVIPSGGGHKLANEIAKFLPSGGATGIGSVPDFNTAATAGADAGGVQMLEVPISINGHEIARAIIPDLERFSKSGKMRTHTQAIKRY